MQRFWRFDPGEVPEGDVEHVTATKEETDALRKQVAELNERLVKVELKFDALISAISASSRMSVHD